MEIWIYKSIFIIFRTSVSVRADNSHDRQFSISYSCWSAHTRKRKRYNFFFYFSLSLSLSKNNVMFSVAISRFVEKSICRYCGCILQYIYCLSNIWYSGHTGVELSWSKISSIYSRRMPIKWFVKKKEQDCSEPKESVRISVMYLYFGFLLFCCCHSLY